MTAIDWVLSAACVWLSYRCYRLEARVTSLECLWEMRKR